MTKTNMYFLNNLGENGAYIEEKAVSNATIQDMRDVDYTWEDCGCEKIDKDVDDEDSLWNVNQYTEPMSYEKMLECETGLFLVSYWDGNNWQKDVYDDYQLLYIENCIIEEDYEKRQNPCYHFVYKLTIENEKIEVTQSNCSGCLSPYYML